MRRAVLMGAAVAALMALTALAPVAGVSAQTDVEKVLVIAVSSDIEAMDPAKTSSMVGPPSMIYETLITRDLNGDYADGLAEWWFMNRSDPDQPRFEIRLKEGVVFHDGLPFTTDAVRRVINYYAQGDSWVQYMFWSVYGCENKTGWPDAGIWCKDDYNMALNLTWADVGMEFALSNLYGSMPSPDALEEDGLALYGTPEGQVVGTGPFMLDEWVPGDHVTLVKNPDYTWGFSWYENKGPANIDTVIYRIMPAQNEMFAGFESGAIDVLQQLAPTKIEEYSDYPGVSLVTGPGQGVYHVVFNCMKDPWTSASLRRAAGYSIDRSEVLSTIWRGVGQEGVNYLPPILPESTAVPSDSNYSFDLDMAMGLFADAGYEDTDYDGWLEGPSGELSLELWTVNKGEDFAMGEMVQSQLEDVGIHVTVTMYSETQLATLAASGEHEAILSNYAWPRAEILDWLLGSWAMGGSNIAWYTDPMFDNYVTNWSYAQSLDEYLENATAGHIRLLTEGPWAPILYWDQIFAIHTNVTGWDVNPFGQEHVFNIVDVDLLTEEPTPEPPALSITSPEEGAVVSEPTVVVTGVTDPGAAVVVNGLLVAVDATGAFELTVALVGGVNEISATATDDMGETTMSVNVTYDSPVPELTEQIGDLENQTSQLQEELQDALDSLEDAESRLDDSNGTIQNLEATQMILIAALASAVVVMAVLGYLVLRARKT
jgi:peptide/nickel transport system substrate-binding protein